MNFLKQIPAEAKNMLRSKFILISFIGIFLLVVVGFPILNYIGESFNDNYYYYGGYDDPVIIDGVEYNQNNEMIWEYRNLTDQMEYMDSSIESDKASEYADDIITMMIEFYETYIPFNTTDYSEDIYDYRERFSYTIRDEMVEKYFLEQTEELDEAALNEANMFIYYFDPLSVLTYNDLTDAEKQERIAEIDQNISDFDILMKENDFSKYVDMQMRSYENDIKLNLERIEDLEADIIENPEQEEILSEDIERLLLNNQRIEENEIPMLQYRVDNNIVIDDGSWQDEAIQSMENSQNSIFWMQSEMDNADETQFYEDQWQVEQYGNFDTYIESLQKQINEAEEELFIAESSIENGKPDMSYVPDGARTRVYGHLMTIILVMVFAVLLGGWLIAHEFSSGTIRLLMIRPRTRLKVMYSKYIAGLLLTFIMFIAIMIVTLIVSGFTNGFADYGYPNYTASGQLNFFVSLILDMLASCSVLVFVYSLSYTMSVVTKNIAVSIIVPVIIMFGGFVLMGFLSMRAPIDILAYTPLPYITIYDFFNDEWNTVSELMDKGMPISLELGVAVMLIYSVVLMVIGTLVFKKQDITN